MSDKKMFKAVSWPVFIEQQAKWMPLRPLVMIVPDSEDKEQVASLFTDLDETEIFTVTELVERYAVKSLGQKGLISTPFMESIIGKIINTGLVPYLNIETNRQGYIRAITAFINNYRCSSTTSLKQAFYDFEIEKPGFRENDLIKIYNEYEQRLSEQGVDCRSALESFFDRVTADNLCSGFGFANSTSFVFFGFSHLTALEAKFFKYLIRYAPQIVFLHCADEKASEQSRRIEASLTEVLAEFSSRQLEALTTGDAHSDSFAPAARALFQVTGSSAGRHDLEIDISKENNRFMEVASMAVQINELKKKGADLSRIKVILPEYDLYSTLIGEVFPEYRIPYTLSKGMPLTSYPPAKVINALVCQGNVSNPYPLREMIFSSPYISYQTGSSIRGLYEYQVSAGVNMLTEQEIAALKGREGSKVLGLDYPYIKALSRKAYRAVNPAPGMPVLTVVAQYLDQLTWNNENEKKKAFYKALQQFFALQKAEKALIFGKLRLNSREFKAAVLDLLERFNFEMNISLGDVHPYTAEEQSSTEAIVEKRDRCIVREVKKLLDDLVQKMDPETRLPVSELIKVFERLIKEARFKHLFPPNPEEEGTTGIAAVKIEPIEQGHYQPGDYIFVCGLVDGEFPAKEEFNFLQPQKEGLGLGRAYTSVDYARHRFYHLVRSAREALYVRAPVSYNGRMLPLSPFMQELSKQLADKKDEISARKDAGNKELPSEKPAGIRDKLIFIGKNVDENYDLVRPLLVELDQTNQAYTRRLLDILRYDGLTMRTSSLSEYDGLFLVAGTGDEIAGNERERMVFDKLAQSIGRITFTPEVIERYASCPLRFFLDNIMGLKKEPDYHPDTTERGTLVRSFLQEYTQAAAEKGGVPEDAARMLYESITTYFAGRENDFADAFEKRFQNRLVAGLNDQEARRPGLFAAFLNFENESPERLVPFARGLTGTLDLEGQLSIEINIDRVDLAPVTNSLIIYQYSTAGTGDVSKMLRGLRFDLPLALLYLVENGQKYCSGKEVSGAGVYLVKTPKQIKRGGYLAKENLRAKYRDQVSEDEPLFSGQREGFWEDQEFDDRLQFIKEEVLRIYRLMHRGVFHLPLCSETDQSCANCSFYRICRKDQLRLDRLYYNLQNEPCLYRVKPAAK
ncbi:MAG: PD-(D/E)XK nuclease family protein [Bacillota bacterium]